MCVCVCEHFTPAALPFNSDGVNTFQQDFTHAGDAFISLWFSPVPRRQFQGHLLCLKTAEVLLLEIEEFQNLTAFGEKVRGMKVRK